MGPVHSQQLPDAQPTAAVELPAPDLAPSPAVSRAPATVGPTVRRALTVGAADDPLERDADRRADEALRAIATSNAPDVLDGSDARVRAGGRVRRSSRTSTGTQRRDHSPTGSAPRIRRSAPIGLAGGSLDTATSDRIERRRGHGGGLDDRVRQRMERGFGADLGHINIHAGREASSLNESMQAQAFTIGNDIFFHDSTPSLSSSAGEQLLAHEIAHTFQQSGAGHRSIRRKMMSPAAFDESTDEGWFTARSKAQDSIHKLLASYHAQFPWERQMMMGALQAKAAIGLLEQIRLVAKMWIKDHEVDVNGVVTADPKRKKRRAGMDALVVACETEMLTLRDLIQYQTTGDIQGADHNLAGITVDQPSEEYSKIKQAYEGDAVSAFRKLGFLIDGAVPMAGDKASIAMEVTIPIPPGFITLELKTEASRPGERVEAGITVGVKGGASVGNFAKISAGLGCFLSAKAKTGADVAELMSYALFRRCRQSPVIPREFTNTMFGGGRSGDFGWVKAEQWSLGVENRIFGADAGAEVSSGVYGKVGAEFEVAKDLAKLGIEVKGTSSDTINKESIERAKGGTGQRNKTTSGSDVTDGGGVRGTTQKSLATQKLGLEVAGSFGVGILSGGVTVELGWSKTKVVKGQPAYQFDTFKVSANLAGEMPMSKMANNPIAASIPNYVTSINKIIRIAMANAQAQTKAQAGGIILDDVAGQAASIAELASVKPETWLPFSPSEAKAGTEIGSKATLELAGAFDFMATDQDDKFFVELRIGKQAGISTAIEKSQQVVNVFKFDVTKSSRLVKVTYKGGSWAVS